jgi:manganese efflux pump family protein
MGIAALITWLSTAGVGLYLLAVWLIEYDREFQAAAPTRLPIPVISGHALLAVTGLVLWMAYLFTDSAMLAWAALAVLGGVVALGLTMARRWLSVYRAPGTPAPPPERNFPVPVVIGHGVLAAVTVTLVAITTLSG